MLKYQTHLDEYSDEIIQTTDKPSVRDRLHNLKLYGKSIQDGEPTPENPVEIKTVPSSFDITSCGKNIFQMNSQSSILTTGMPVVNVTWDADEQTLTFNGTSTNPGAFQAGHFTLKHPAELNKTYVLTFIPVSGSISSAYGNVGQIGLGDNTSGASGNSIYSSIPKKWEGTVSVIYNSSTMRGTNLRLYVHNNQTFDNFKIKIQLEEGSTATDYVPYTATTVPFAVRDTNNNLHELCSLPDVTSDEVNAESGKIIKRIDTETNSLLPAPQVYDLHPDELEKLKSLKSVYPQTIIFTDAAVQPAISCSVRKLGNRPFIDSPIIDENGDYLVDENGNNIIGVI